MPHRYQLLFLNGFQYRMDRRNPIHAGRLAEPVQNLSVICFQLDELRKQGQGV